MATRVPHAPKRPMVDFAALRDGFARRVELARAPAPEHAHGPQGRLIWGELASPFVHFRRTLGDTFELPKATSPRVVMLLPGFGTHPLRMRYMARKLEQAGHKVKRWGLGFNLGPSEENFALLEARIEQIRQRYGQDVVLVGWSLGGIFARELAKRRPELIAKVVTMGSPFSGSPYENNAWRIYEAITGHSVEQPPVEAQLNAKPPVETVALWSPRDGVVAPRCARGLAGERDREQALRCTHLGFANSPEAIRAVAAELERR